MYLVKFLKTLKFFASKKTSDVKEIALCLLMEPFEDDEMVFDQGDYGNKFYIILKGEVRVDICVRKEVSAAEQEARMLQFTTEVSNIVLAIK